MLPTNTLAMQDILRDKERPPSPPHGAPAEATGSRFIPQPLDERLGSKVLKTFSNLTNSMILHILPCVWHYVLSKPTCLKAGTANPSYPTMQSCPVWLLSTCTALCRLLPADLCGAAGQGQKESDIVDGCLEVLWPDQGKLSEIHQEN